jgi:hypothetical protein
MNHKYNYVKCFNVIAHVLQNISRINDSKPKLYLVKPYRLCLQIHSDMMLRCVTQPLQDPSLCSSTSRACFLGRGPAMNHTCFRDKFLPPPGNWKQYSCGIKSEVLLLKLCQQISPPSPPFSPLNPLFSFVYQAFC